MLIFYETQTPLVLGLSRVRHQHLCGVSDTLFKCPIQINYIFLLVTCHLSNTIQMGHPFGGGKGHLHKQNFSHMQAITYEAPTQIQTRTHRY